MTKPPNPVDKHVGSRVRMRRKTIDMSQQKLGDVLGLTFQQVQKYERGANRIGSSNLQKIASALSVPVAWFFEGAPTGALAVLKGGDEIVSLSMVSDFLATSDGLALTGAFMRVPNVKLRRKVVQLVEAIADEAAASKRKAA